MFRSIEGTRATALLLFSRSIVFFSSFPISSWPLGRQRAEFVFDLVKYFQTLTSNVYALREFSNGSGPSLVPVARYNACEIAWHILIMGIKSGGSVRNSAGISLYNAHLSLYSAHTGTILVEGPLLL